MAMSCPVITVVDTSLDHFATDHRLKELLNEVTRDLEEPMSQKEFKEGIARQTFTDHLFQILDFGSNGTIHRDTLVDIFGTCFQDTREKRVLEPLLGALKDVGVERLGRKEFWRIFQVNSVQELAYSAVDESKTGLVNFRDVMEFLSHFTQAKPKSGLTNEELQHVQKVFQEATRGQDEINLEDFRKIIKSRNIFFTERVFSVFDRDRSGTVSLQEFIDAIGKLVGQSPDEKINFLFKIYDIDADGFIQHSELRHVMTACMVENGMKFSEEQIEDLTTALFEDADPSNTGAITFEALKAQLAKHEGLLENLSSSIERWLVPPPPDPPLTWKGKLERYLPHWARWKYVKNNHVFLGFLFVFCVINLALFISRACEYWDSNSLVILARACGQCLNFTCVMVLVFMLRNCITWLRCHGLSSLLPLDDHILFHKITGSFIVFYASLHTIMHLCNYNHLASQPPNPTNLNLTFTEYLFTTKSKGGLVDGCAAITGVLLVVVFAVMILCSLRCVRKSGRFEVFYWTHQLYVVFWLLLIFHGPNFWKWFIGPAIVYILERMVRGIRLATRHGKTVVTEGVLLPSKVTHLVIRRPPHFDYCPGDYIFVRIPAIAHSEWHPFTLSSAPEQDDFLWLHIRGVGEWTNQLHDYIEKQSYKLKELGDADKLELEDLEKPEVNVKEDLDKNGSAKKELPLKSPVRFQLGHENLGFEKDSDVNETSFKMSPVMLRVRPSHKNLTTCRSMPDVDLRMKTREKNLLSRELVRANSEKSLDTKCLRRARTSITKTFYNRHRNSMAQSFKYLRNKPNVVPLSPVSEDHDAEGDGGEEVKLECTEVIVTTPGSAKRQSTNDRAFFGKPLEIYLDGPFGAPSSHIFRAQHAVLIATGIGVTPFASILQSIMRRYWKERHTCPKCYHSWTGQVPRSVMNLRKVDFFWINRDQRSFEWFVNLLSQLEIEQAELGGAMERFLDMHMYITSALQRADMKAIGLQLALDLLHDKEKRDLITGLKTRTQAGRPNWTKVFKQISAQRKGKITVFYCGPPELGRTLQVKCDEFGFTFKKEVF